MENRYCNFTGNQKIKDTYDLIPKGFSKVQIDMDEVMEDTDDLQRQINSLVVDGDSSPAIDQALAGTGFETLREYLDSHDSRLLGLALENVDQDVEINAINNNLANKLRNNSIANGMTQTYILTVNALIIVGRGAIGPDAYGMYFVDLACGIITIHENSSFVVTCVDGVISVTNNIGSNCGIMVIL